MQNFLNKNNNIDKKDKTLFIIIYNNHSHSKLLID